jgi:hypothetical protein
MSAVTEVKEKLVVARDVGLPLALVLRHSWFRVLLLSSALLLSA